MPEFVGLFDRFSNLDQISIENVMRWLNPVPLQVSLENYIANRILYPQAVPVLFSEIRIDLAILREALRLNNSCDKSDKNTFLGNSPFINTTLRKIIIPANFLEYIPDLASLIWAFNDGLLLDHSKKDLFEDLWTICIDNNTEEIVGSILLPQFTDIRGLMEIKLESKTYHIKAGTQSILPCFTERCQISFNFKNGKLLGKSKSSIELSGGKMGLFIDGRIK